MCKSLPTHMNVAAHRGSDLELELPEILSCLVRSLKLNLGPPEVKYMPLTTKQSLQAQLLIS